jgi:S-adenosylmethionine-diacylglycerol 3-amino-3-carboxypropyl transferase
MGNFYSRLSYSFGNEDWKTEKKALNIQPEDQVICVTASGDRPLNLLTNQLARLVSVDANPMQNALFDLKKAALLQLSYEEYAAFLGVTAYPDRLDLFHTRLKRQLTPLSNILLRPYYKKIAKGILYQGALEIWIRRIAHFIQFCCGDKVNELFSFADAAKQRSFLETEWNTETWRNAFQIIIRPLFVRPFIQDPGLYAYVDPNITAGRHIYDKIHDFLCRSVAQESVLLSLLFQGKVEESALPIYLKEEGHEPIKGQLDRVNFVTADLIAFLEEAPHNSYNCFSVSDVASYIDQNQFNRMTQAMYKTARPGARFCIRQFLSNHRLPEKIAPHFKRNHPLEKELELEDRCVIYRFMVGTIEK